MAGKAKTKTKKLQPPKQQFATTVPQRKNTAVSVITGIVVLLLLGASGMVAYAQTTQDRIVSGIRIAGLSVGGLPRPAALAKAQEALNAYEQRGVAITLDGVSATTVPLRQLGIRFDLAATMNDAFAVGRSTRLERWLLHPFLNKPVDIPARLIVDEQPFPSFVQSFSAARTVAVTEPSLQIENGTVTVIPGQNGMTAHATTTFADMQESVSKLQAAQVAFSRSIEQPKLIETDLADTKIAAETMMSGPLTLTYGSRRFVVSKEELQTWIQYSYDPSKATSDPREGIVLSLNRDLAGRYLTSLDSSVGVPAKPTFGFDAEALGEYAYKNWQGREVKVEETLAAIVPALQDTAPRSVELIVGPSDPPIEKLAVTAPKPAGKVIEVDLSRQALLAFEDGKLKFFTRVSTGLPSHATPTGEWKIYNKTRIQSMIGQGYNLPNVKWVMAYNGDYTLHTAYWHNDFGIPKSHGCTNMAEADAKWLFDWAPVGTPVVIRESST